MQNRLSQGVDIYRTVQVYERSVGRVGTHAPSYTLIGYPEFTQNTITMLELELRQRSDVRSLTKYLTTFATASEKTVFS